MATDLLNPLRYRSLSIEDRVELSINKALPYIREGMSALRFCSEMNIPVYGEGVTMEQVGCGLSYFNILMMSRGNSAVLYSRKHDRNDFIVTKAYDSQLIKNISLWHEIGHWLDFTTTPPSASSTLLQEAVADIIAIKLIRKVGQYNDKIKAHLLFGYDSYLYHDDHKNETNLRHLIEQA